MATSIQPGGAYLSADKKTWHDANGNVIPAPVSPIHPEDVKNDPEPKSETAPEPKIVLVSELKGNVNVPEKKVPASKPAKS